MHVHVIFSGPGLQFRLAGLGSTMASAPTPGASRAAPTPTPTRGTPRGKMEAMGTTMTMKMASATTPGTSRAAFWLLQRGQRDAVDVGDAGRATCGTLGRGNRHLSNKRDSERCPFCYGRARTGGFPPAHAARVVFLMRRKSLCLVPLCEGKVSFKRR
jgi:hypothetical protein